MTEFLPQFGGVAFTILAFVVALSVVVAFHELGHLMVGRWTGIRAEVYSVGFGPVLASRVDRHGTRWQVAALPFGGFVKFWGDANAASVGGDPNSVDPGLRRHTMLGAPIWARALTVAAGPFANFLLAAVVFAALIAVQGEPADPLTVASIAPLPESYATELETGDRILSIAGVPVTATTWGQVAAAEIDVQPRVPYEIERDGVAQTVEGPWPIAPLVGSVTPSSAASDAGLRSGDVIVAVDGTEVWDFQQVFDRVVGGEGAPLTLSIWRDGAVTDLVVAPRRSDVLAPDGGFESRFLLGIAPGNLFEVEMVSPGPAQAVWDGISQVGFVISSSLSGIVHMVSGTISTCAISGPVGIAEVSGEMASQGTIAFLWFLAVLSSAVGLMNLFPIPVLDGGHLVFHAWEAATGRPPGDRALRVLMAAGIALILTMTVFGVLNDLILCP